MIDLTLALMALLSNGQNHNVRIELKQLGFSYFYFELNPMKKMDGIWNIYVLEYYAFPFWISLNLNIFFFVKVNLNNLALTIFVFQCLLVKLSS